MKAFQANGAELLSVIVPRYCNSTKLQLHDRPLQPSVTGGHLSLACHPERDLWPLLCPKGPKSFVDQSLQFGLKEKDVNSSSGRTIMEKSSAKFSFKGKVFQSKVMTLLANNNGSSMHKRYF